MDYLEAKRFKTQQDFELIISIIITSITILLPILASIFLYYPLMQDIKTIKAQKENVEKKIHFYQEKYDIIANEKPEKIINAQQKLEDLLPSKLTLAELGIFITKQASSNNLVVDRLILNENNAINSNFIIKTNNKDLVIQKIQGPVRVSGKKEDIFNFLDFLGTGEYAVEFDKVTVEGGIQNNKWDASFMVIHYYMPQVKNVPLDEPIIKIDWNWIE